MILEKLKSSIIISIQSTEGDPTNNIECKLAFMKSAIIGGAKAFRLAGVNDVILSKAHFPNIPVIAITKPKIIPQNYKELVYITPTPDDAKKLIEAGADIIAFDGTNRHDYSKIIETIHNSGKIAMADISTLDEGILAYKLGSDIVSTTLSGYTIHSKQSDMPDFELLKNLTDKNIPTIMEGKIWERNEAKHAFELGAHAIVIGSAVTRPWNIVERFVNYDKKSTGN